MCPQGNTRAMWMTMWLWRQQIKQININFCISFWLFASKEDIRAFPLAALSIRSIELGVCVNVSRICMRSCNFVFLYIAQIRVAIVQLAMQRNKTIRRRKNNQYLYTMMITGVIRWRIVSVTETIL